MLNACIQILIENIKTHVSAKARNLKKFFALEKHGGRYATIILAFQLESLPQRQNKNYESFYQESIFFVAQCRNRALARLDSFRFRTSLDQANQPAAETPFAADYRPAG